MDATEARRIIRTRLRSGILPRTFDLTSFAVGCPPRFTKCSGCGETFLSSYIDAVAHRRSVKQYWFHQHCKTLWQEERSLNHPHPLRNS